MPIPARNIKVKIVNVASGEPLGVRGRSDRDKDPIVQDSSDPGTRYQEWLLIPLPPQDGKASQQKDIEEVQYRIENVGSKKVIDAGQKDNIFQYTYSEYPKNDVKHQRWLIMPVEGKVDQYRIESVDDHSVLDLKHSSKEKEDGVQIVSRKYDKDAESQRWQFVPSPSEPERGFDQRMRWTASSHWNGRQSWKLVPAALQPKPDARPAFSDMKLVLDGGVYGYDVPPGYDGGWTLQENVRLLADTTGNKHVDIVPFSNKGVAVRLGNGDGTFPSLCPLLEEFGSDDKGWTVGKHPRLLVDTTGDGHVDIVGFFNDGVWVARGQGNGTFAFGKDGKGGKEKVVLRGDFGYEQGWRVDQHLRLLADITGDKHMDIIGFNDLGVWVSLQDEDGKFAPKKLVLEAFKHNDDVGGWTVDKHPVFLAETIADMHLDIVGFHDEGVLVSQQKEEGEFGDPERVVTDFGCEQGWISVKEHPRFLVKTTGDGRVADVVGGFDPQGKGVSRGVIASGDGRVDIVGFGPEGVVVSRGDGEGGFARAELVLNDFGSNQGWTGARHVRLLADTTGDGQVDIVGFGDEGVWVSRGSGDGQFGQAELVCAGFGYNDEAGGWTVERHLRFLADTTGNGRPDIVGFGGPGVYVALNLNRKFVTRYSLREN